MAYIIVEKQKNDTRNIWNAERFLTGGSLFSSYKEAQDTKKAIQKMSNSIKYKVTKI